MKKVNYLIVCAVMLCLSQYNLFSEENEDVRGSRHLGNAFVHGLIASGETLFSNGFVLLIDEYVFRTPWALPTAESVRLNFTQPWVWESYEDSFFYNQLGHSYQGSVYFNAGRANGFSFYESVFFTALGSFTWETIGENMRASINDFITTNTSALVFGEILYRLYIEACMAGVPAPIAFFINPMAGFHRLITGWKPPQTGRNLYRFDTYLGGGYMQLNYSFINEERTLVNKNTPFIELGLNIIYGNPFEQETTVPFRHFELSASCGSDLYDYFGVRILTDGYLFSFSPVYAEKNYMSMGLSFSHDFASLGKFTAQIVDHYSNAFNWTLKYRYLFSQDKSFQIKNHLGFIFFGVSNFYSPEIRIGDLKNYGYGINSRRFYVLEENKNYKLEINRINYFMWSYPGTSALTSGFVFWDFTDIIFTYYISGNFSLGFSLFFVREWGFFGGYDDTVKRINSLKLFAGWCF